MKVEQIYNILNTMQSELIGGEPILNEDLTNIVDLGKSFEDAIGYDVVTKSLVDHIGRMVFVDRVYGGRSPSVLVDSWEWGAIMEKISTAMPEAQENESWELTDGQEYSQDIFKKPEAFAKFFSERVTYDIQLSVTTDQMKSAFSNATQMNSFMSMLYTSVSNSMTVKTDALVMRTINNFIGETLYNEFNGGVYSGASGVKAVNLLFLYNATLPEGSTALTAEEFLRTPEAIKFAVNTFMNYMDRLKVMSTLFNVGGQERFTPEDRLHVVMLSEFYNSASVYLTSDTFHDEYVRLPQAERVVYWQGSGIDYGFDSTSHIMITTSGGHTVNASGILGVMFDRDALGVANIDRKVTSHYNAKADFTNNFYHNTAGYWNDLNENFVVFYVA